MEPLRIWFDPPHVRWGRVAVTVVAVTALVGLWVAERRGVFDPAPERVSMAVRSSASAPGTLGPELRERTSASAPDANAAAAPSPERAASSVEVFCGVPPEQVDPADPAQIERVAAAALEKLEAHRRRVLPGWLEEMKSSADEQVQAAAWFLEAREIAGTRLMAVGTGGAIDKMAAFDALDELARLAERSRDPMTYALAFQACDLFQRVGAAPACNALRVEAWAERDPGNAYPWLVAASRQGVVSQRRTQYLETAMAIGEMRGTWGSMHGVMAKAAPTGEAPLDRSVRFFEAAAADSAVAIPQAIVVDHCSDTALRQGARRQQCERLAAFLTDKGDSYLFARVGNGIGRRLGWSEDRLARYTAEHESFIGVLPPDAFGTGCDGLARAEAYFADVAKYGERGALRRRQQAAR